MSTNAGMRALAQGRTSGQASFKIWCACQRLTESGNAASRYHPPALLRPFGLNTRLPEGAPALPLSITGTLQESVRLNGRNATSSSVPSVVSGRATSTLSITFSAARRVALFRPHCQISCAFGSARRRNRMRPSFANAYNAPSASVVQANRVPFRGEDPSCNFSKSKLIISRAHADELCVGCSSIAAEERSTPVVRELQTTLGSAREQGTHSGQVTIDPGTGLPFIS